MYRWDRILFFLVLMFSIIASGSNYSQAIAEEDGKYEPAVIRYADLGGIKDWRAEGIKAILIQGINGQWYRATFFSECFELPWAERVAFVTNADGNLDQYSSIIAGGRRCYFKKVVKISTPE